MSFTVAVTGASGLLGGNVCALLLDRGLSVRALGRAPNPPAHLSHLALDWRVIALTERSTLIDAFRGAKAVLHCAGSVVQSRWLRKEHIEANVQGTRAVLVAAVSAGIERVVHCSSTVTCGLSLHGEAIDEQHEWNLPEFGFNDGYALSKHMAESIVLRQTSLDAVVVNPGYMIGPMDGKPSSGRLIIEYARRPIIGIPVGTNNFVDVRDVATGMITALHKGRRGERYILGGENLSYRQFLSITDAALGRPCVSRSLWRPAAKLAGWLGDAVELVTDVARPINSATVRYAFCSRLRFSSAKAKAELDYGARPIHHAVSDAIAWFRQVGMLD